MTREVRVVDACATPLNFARGEGRDRGRVSAKLSRLAGKGPLLVLLACFLGSGNCLFVRAKPLPLVGRRPIVSVAISQSIFGRPPPFGIPSATRLRHLNKAKRHQLKDCRMDRMPIDAVALKVVVGHGEPTVIPAPMVRHFDFNPCEHAMCTQAQHPIGREIPASRWSEARTAPESDCVGYGDCSVSASRHR